MKLKGKEFIIARDSNKNIRKEIETENININLKKTITLLKLEIENQRQIFIISNDKIANTKGIQTIARNHKMVFCEIKNTF